ncbi:hypothetical protein QKC54_gp0449 [Megavirus baoshan]|uniref:Uncharacterized protein n=1 Tax=Megavirus baoshan TaxID=2496520 RepID=A0A3Q8U825_9VIRU|nr:hypothetical protein QKC54_gp0449 [Megavirus baoshan]AZL89379.1 hypothetical protein Mb0623 [Megavirus baoshan]
MNVALFLEIKNEYTEHLVDILTPYIYEGLTSIYKAAVDISEKAGKESHVLMTFQKLLQTINTWPQTRIEQETIRIKTMSNTSEYMDDLIKAVIKSNIILLTYSNTISNLIGQTFYNGLTTPTFIHRCYTECGKDAHNNPYLFYHDVSKMDYKRNQSIIYKNIQDGIIKAIRKILPISMILKEYLINSVNIIQEPTRVELSGPNVMNAFDPSKDNINMPGFKNASESKIMSEKKLEIEKEVLGIIKSESIKPDDQKIQAIMNLEKMVAVNNNPIEFIQSNRKISSINKNNQIAQSEINIAPHFMEQEYDQEYNLGYNEPKYNENRYGYDHEKENISRRLNNINFDEEPTVHSGSNKKTISGTTLSTRPMPNLNLERRLPNPETSERIDPNDVQLIENYGVQQYGGTRNKHQNNKYGNMKF